MNAMQMPDDVLVRVSKVTEQGRVQIPLSLSLKQGEGESYVSPYIFLPAYSFPPVAASKRVGPSFTAATMPSAREMKMRRALRRLRRYVGNVDADPTEEVQRVQTPPALLAHPMPYPTTGSTVAPNALATM